MPPFSYLTLLNPYLKITKCHCLIDSESLNSPMRTIKCHCLIDLSFLQGSKRSTDPPMKPDLQVTYSTYSIASYLGYTKKRTCNIFSYLQLPQTPMRQIFLKHPFFHSRRSPYLKLMCHITN